MPDHSSYAHAFGELALLVFIELLEEAARYLDAFARAADTCDIFGDDAEDAEEEPAAETSVDDASERPAWQRFLELAYAAGFVLRTKVDGWKLFCERMNIPPFLVWEGFPGFDRLRRALTLAEKAAFPPEGFLSWLNAVRPAGKPKLTEVSLTVEGVASATEDMFRQRVEWWGGSSDEANG